MQEFLRYQAVQYNNFKRINEAKRKWKMEKKFQMEKSQHQEAQHQARAESACTSAVASAQGGQPPKRQRGERRGKHKDWYDGWWAAKKKGTAALDAYLQQNPHWKAIQYLKGTGKEKPSKGKGKD